VSEYAIGTVLLKAGCTWQRARRRRRTGQVVRKCKTTVGVNDPDAEAWK
jgi:hypothetical protein